MTRDLDTGPSADEPETPKKQPKTRWWNHHHLSFVIAVLTRYKIKIYRHKKVHPGEIGEGIESWDEEDQTLAIQEGRRQLDSQFSELQYVTTRASVLLTVGVAASVFFLTSLDDLNGIEQPWRTITCILLLSGSGMMLLGALVMGALIGDRAPFKQTDIVIDLTNEPGELRRFLARDYAENVPTGVDTNAARLTHLGTGVIWIAAGAVLGMIGLWMSMWSAPTSHCDGTSTSPEVCLDSGQTTDNTERGHTPSADIGNSR